MMISRSEEKKIEENKKKERPAATSGVLSLMLLWWRCVLVGGVVTAFVIRALGPPAAHRAVVMSVNTSGLRRAVVMGATSGIGEACALRLASEGFR